jgi:hypothetical protein
MPKFLVFEFHSQTHLGEGVYDVPPVVGDAVSFKATDGQMTRGLVRGRSIENQESQYSHQLFVTHVSPYKPLVVVEELKPQS